MEAIWGLIGTIIGASVSIITTNITNKNSQKLQEKMNSFDRKEKEREFQRVTLLELQENISKYMRLIFKINFTDSQSLEKNGKKNLLSEELNLEENQTKRKILVLVERIEDDSLRNMIYEYINESMSVLDNSFDSKKYVEYYKRLNKELGKTLRKYFHVNTKF